MTWSVSVPSTPAEEFAKAVDAAHISDEYNKAELVSQWREQLEAAKRAALALLSREGFGHGGSFRAEFSGHANHAGAGEGTHYMVEEFIHVNVIRTP